MGERGTAGERGRGGVVCNFGGLSFLLLFLDLLNTVPGTFFLLLKNSSPSIQGSSQAIFCKLSAAAAGTIQI